MVFTTDGKGLLRHLNEGGVRLLGGAARKDWIGKRTLESLFARPDEADAIRELVFRDGAVQDVETSFRRLDETVVPVSLSFSSSGCQGGGLAGEGVVLDIGERKQREKFLQETAEVYHTVVEHSLAAISPPGWAQCIRQPPIRGDAGLRQPCPVYGSTLLGLRPSR
jgi:PAS domain-containing protein